MHEALDPEFSILKQRLARRMCYEGTDEEGLQKMTLVDMTHVGTLAFADGMLCTMDVLLIVTLTGVTPSYRSRSTIVC